MQRTLNPEPFLTSDGFAKVSKYQLEEDLCHKLTSLGCIFKLILRFQNLKGISNNGCVLKDTSIRVLPKNAMVLDKYAQKPEQCLV